MDRSVGAQQSKLLDRIIEGVAILMIAYHLYAVWFPTFNSLLHQNIHLGFCMTILFLFAMKSSKRWIRFCIFLGLVTSLICVIYIHIQFERLHMWAGFPEPRDIVVGIALVLLVVYLTWRTWGIIFPVLIGISILYAFFGHHIKGTLGHPHYDFGLVLSNLGIGFEGIYGMLLNASVNLIFLFIIFGSLFEAVGINRFFLELGTLLGRHLRGGAAQTAVFSSSFVGMCTGAAVANVALTGSYTIPLMKKVGFHPKQAAAIEAVASTGGQLTPPIMGVSIFLMAGFLGVSYADLMATALIPAVTYYAVSVFGVILIANRDNIPRLKTQVNKKIILHRLPLFVIPMTMIVYLLIKRYSPAYAAFLGIIAILAIAMLQKETRPSLAGLFDGLVKGARMGGAIGIACAAIGMFAKMLIFTGAGHKLANIIQVLSGGNLIVALISTMILAIILGCAVPTPVAYVMAALVVSPVLQDMGVSMLVSHFFVFYSAVLSAITPPVAPAALVGSQIAGADFNQTGWESFKIAVPFFLVPYFIVLNPIILSKGQPFFEATLAIVGLFIGCTSLMAFFHGYLFVKTAIWERGLFLVTAFFAVYYGIYGVEPAMLISTIMFIILVIGQLRKRQSAGRIEKSENVESEKKVVIST